MIFHTASAVTRAGESYHAEIKPDWDIVGNANGGYLMAIAARAMADSSKPHPVSLTAHFLCPGRPGPVTINPTIVREGRTFTTVRATLAAERPLLELLGSFSDLSNSAGDVRVDAHPPELPPPDQCIPVIPDPASGFPPPMMSQVDMRLHPEDGQFFQGRPSGEPLIRGWIRLKDDEPVDPFALLLIADAFPPTIFNANLPVAWTPTLELTAHIRSIPVPGWLRCRFSTRFITGGMLEEDGEIWDESGRLVAQSRQLALMPRG